MLGGLWSSHLCTRQHVSNELFHITDWMPTIVHLAGGRITDPTVDGVNQWPALCRNGPSPRKEVLINVDQVSSYRSLIIGDWKLVNGSPLKGVYDTWLSEGNDRTEANEALAGDGEDYDDQCGSGTGSGYGESVVASLVGEALSAYPSESGPLSVQRAERLRSQSAWTCNGVPHLKCDAQKGPCLFNVVQDPCERFNLARIYPEVVNCLHERLEYFESVTELPRNRPDDRRSDPRYFNETWTWWFDELGLDRDPHALTELIQLDGIADAVYENFGDALDTMAESRLGEL